MLDLSLEELSQVKVIIATGTQKTLNKAPATVTVITAEDIKLTGATNLTEVLESVPGIHINHNDFADRPLIHMRGTGSFQTLLMINGNDTRNLVWAFGIFWKGIPVNAIERIEVIRGPGSALYGADASAGVINVITKTAGDIKTNELGVRAGSFDSQNAWVQYGNKWNDFKINFTADFSTTDAHDPFISADRSNTSGKVQYGWKSRELRLSIANKHWRFLSSFIEHDDLETGLTGAGFFDPVTKAENQRLDLDLIYDNSNLSENWGINAKLHYQDLDYSSNNGFQEAPPSTTYPAGKINHMSSSERQMSFEASALYRGLNQHNIRIGSGYDWQDLYRVNQKVNFGTGPNGQPLPAGGPLVDLSDTGYAFAPEKTRKLYYFFIQDVWAFADDWELTTGARYDHYSDFGDTINPRVALTWQTTHKLTTKLMYGQSFRSPSFQELYAITSRSIANPKLDPEKSETLELAFSYAATKDLRLSMNLFEFEITDFISRDLNNQYQNMGENKTLGMEMEINWKATKTLSLSGNYTYRNPDNNDFRQTSEAQQEAYIRSDWKFKPGWNWNLQTSWIADRHRAKNDLRPDTSDYTITDTTLRYTGIKRWELVTSVRNLFNEDARESTSASIPDDLPLPERHFYAELRYKF